MSEIPTKLNPQTCRLCLSTTYTFFSLIMDNEDSHMLEAVTSLRISTMDDISTVMCLKCRLNLKLAYQIQQNMLKAEQKFRERQALIRKECVEKIDLTVCDVVVDVVETDKYDCDLCDKKNFTKYTLGRHKYNVHIRAKCPLCNIELTHTYLKRHIARHDMEQVVCEICGASIKKCDMKLHLNKTHQDGKFKCQFCDKIFKANETKKTHENREHLNNPTCVCDICGKNFFQKADLQKHVRSTHEKLRPHVCDFCKVGFSSRYAMLTHRRQHTNETPFKCEVCGDGFRQKVSLRSHLRSKHKIEEELVEECRDCGKRFGSKAALISHRRLHL